MRLIKLILIVITFFLCLATEVRAQTSQVSFSLQWQDNSNNEEGFYIYRDGKNTGTTAANVNTYIDTLTGNWGAQVAYQVSAFNHARNPDGSQGALQESTKSNTAFGTIPFPPQPPPTAPSGLVTQPQTQSSIELRWQDNADNETGFVIARSQDFPPYRRTEILIDQPNVTSYVDRNLRRNRPYCYQVSAVTDSSESETSNQSCSTTLR